MAANVSLLMSLIANVLGSGIIFFSGPSSDLAYLHNNTNISIYDIEKLSPVEEKAMGVINIFIDSNQHNRGKLDPKLIRVAGEYRLAIIFKTHQGICNQAAFKTIVKDSESIISNQNKTHAVFHICQLNDTSFLLNVFERESFIHLNNSAVDICGRTIGYQTENFYLKPVISNMMSLTADILCSSDRNCFGIKRKDNNASNPLIRKSPNCYDVCTDTLAATLNCTPWVPWF